MTEPTAASDGASTGQLWGIMVTFRRRDCCARMLEILRNQGLDLRRLIVVDNDSDEEVLRTVEQTGATYIGMATNTGPAGAIAEGMSLFLRHALPGDWVMLFDDDDPPHEPDTVEHMWEFGQVCVERDPSTAAVGRAGARYSRRWGSFVRISDDELRGPVSVDYLGGGQFPLFRYSALAAHGTFDPGFFFGFDDAEFGLRLRGHGHSLYADGDRWLSRRSEFGRRGLTKKRTVSEKSLWRMYYSTRNIVHIGKSYGSLVAPYVAGFGSALRGTANLLYLQRPVSEALLPMRGFVDGLVHRSGRTIDPDAFR